MTYPTPQGGPGKTGYVIGTILLVLGIGGGILAIVLGSLAAVRRVDDYQRVPVGATNETISFSKAGRYNAYYERPGIDKRSEIPPIEIQLIGPDDQKSLTSDISRTDSDESYDFGSHQGVRITGFTISEPGEYDVRFVGEPTGSSSDEIAFGKGSLAILLGGVLGGLFGGGLLALIGLVLLITTGVRRRNYRRRMAYGAYGGYGQPGGYAAPGAYPQTPGWPPAGPGAAPGPWSPPAGQPGQPYPPGQQGQQAQPGQPGQPPGWAPPAQPPPTGPPPAPTGPRPDDPDRPGWGDPQR